MRRRSRSFDPRALLLALGAGLVLAHAARSQTDASQASTANVTAPDREELTTLLTALDEAFEQHSADRFFAQFDGLHLPVLERQRERLTPFFSSKWELERDTEILETWELGAHTVAHLKTEIRRTDTTPAVRFVEHQLIAAKRTADGPRATLLVEIAKEFLPFLTEGLKPRAPGRGFRCEACNYVIDAGSEWLTVPNCQQRVGCLESLSFYALERDLTVHLTVVMAERPQSPGPWLNQLAQELDLQFDSAVRPWTPSAYDTQTAPALMQGVQTTAATSAANRSTEFYFTTYGRLGYLIEVEGRTPTVESRRDAVARLLRSFMLLEPELDPGELVDRVLTMRNAGRLDADGAFVHDGFRLRLAPPTGWTAALNTSTHTFELTFRPTGSDIGDRMAERILVRGIRPPRGFPAWTARATRMTVRKLLPESYRPERMGSWFESEAWKGTYAFSVEETGYAVRELRLAARDDLLIVFEALSGRAKDLDALESHLERFADSLR